MITREEILEMLVVLGGIALLSLIGIGVLATGSYVAGRYISCPNFGQTVGRPVRYNFLAGGCFVQTDRGQWVKTKNYWNSPVETAP